MPSVNCLTVPNLEQLKKQAKSLLARRAGTRSPTRFDDSRCCRRSRTSRADADSPPTISRCTMRSRSSRASMDLRPGTRCARRSRRARCRSTRRSTSSSAARPAAAPRPRRAAARAPSADRVGVRCRRRSFLATPRGGSAAARASRARDAAGRTAELGAAALRLPHVHAQEAIRRASRASSRSRGGCARSAPNPNAEYHWNWHPELPRTALWGAVCAVSHLPLAEVLLEAGANPTDGVTSHIAGGGGNLAALELLHRYGLNVNGIPGGVPPLVYMMRWADKPAGPALAARSRRGSQPRLGRRRRSAAARRGATMGRADGRAARAARRRRLAASRRRRHAAHARGASRQSRHRGVAARARRDGRAVAARAFRRRLRARRSRRPRTRCSPRTRRCARNCGPSIT